MNPGEVLLFKQCKCSRSLCVFFRSLKEAAAPDDTRAEAKNERTVFHSAIHDPATPDDATPRYTIECAVSAEFDVETDKESRVKRFLSRWPSRTLMGPNRPGGMARSADQGLRPARSCLCEDVNNSTNLSLRYHQGAK